MKYLLCLDKNYDIEILENCERFDKETRQQLTIDELEGIIDDMKDLLQSYNIDDDEILDIFRNRGLKITENED